MKTPAIQKLRQKLAAGEQTLGLWVTLDSASVSEMAVGLGLDWIVIDAEHGHLDWKDILDHVRATVRSDTVALVRIEELNGGIIKRVLDIGADGVVIPWVETPEQAQEAVAYATYPPQGKRGIGGERATCWGGCFVHSIKEADDNVLVVPIIESVKAGRNVEAICRVPGIEVVFVGPADYSSTAGYPGQWEGPGVAEDLLRIKDTVRRHGKYCGVVTTGPADLAMRREQGFQLTSLGLDGGLLLRTLTESLAQSGVNRQVVPTFVPENKPGAPVVPAKTRPDKYKPDRREVINVVAEAGTVEIAPGVNFRPLVGKHNNARDFTTGIVTFDPGAELPYHLHTFTESITLLEGRAALEVEGRRYALQQLDNAVIPPGTAHFVSNTSRFQPAVFHISMATESPSRELIKRFYSSKTMAPDSKGVPGAERLNIHAIADWYEPNPGARFVDFMNRDLGYPDMSGGYGIFKPGAQLPCHIHDFDESITIVQGTATCVVEGRRYSMKDNATALVPRGRCHYFINDTDAPMAMVWVYAGPTPERMIMEATMCDIGFGE